MNLEIGQVLSMKVRFNNSGDVSRVNHPYLIIDIKEEYGFIEVAQIDSLEGKEYKAAFRTNKTILKDNPPETVIDKDSYVQLDNKFTLEYYDELSKYRRQLDKLSEGKLQMAISAYKKYQKEHHLDENKIVYMDKNEIEKLNR